ncbi:MAG TPA: hypothetical protein GX747_02570 [Tenericutes bacterium]|nr:hypothetical protein [Mycoplasmatota bacterium]
MRSFFIKPNNEIIEVKPEEINLFCKKTCEKYVLESAENKKEFDSFSTKYTFFKPYYDFVMHKLKYIHVGFLLDNTKYVYSKDNKLIPCDYNFETIDYNELISKKPDSFIIYDGSDETIGLKDEETHFTGTGYILPNKQFLSCNKLEGHDEQADAIMNQLIVENKYILNDYYNKVRYKYPSNSDYLCQRLGFIKKTRAHSGFHTIFYNKKLMNLEQINLIYECINNGMYERLIANNDDIIATKKLIREYRGLI